MEFARVLDALVEVCKSFVHAFEPYRENRKPHLHGLFTICQPNTYIFIDVLIAIVIPILLLRRIPN